MQQLQPEMKMDTMDALQGPTLAQLNSPGSNENSLMSMKVKYIRSNALNRSSGNGSIQVIVLVLASPKYISNTYERIIYPFRSSTTSTSTSTTTSPTPPAATSASDSASTTSRPLRPRRSGGSSPWPRPPRQRSGCRSPGTTSNSSSNNSSSSNNRLVGVPGSPPSL